MNTKPFFCGALLLVWLAVLGAGAAMTAEPARAVSEEVDVVRFTVDGGGGSSQAGDVALTGTAGQADAGVSSGGSFVLVGGFWGGYPQAQEQGTIYVPILQR